MLVFSPTRQAVTRRRLGEILCEMQAATVEQIQEGLKNQVIFGGRLGTNLLELGTREEDVARALAQRHGKPCLHGNLQIDPAVARLLGKEQAARYQAIPYLATERKLALLVRDPDDLQVLDEIAFITGREVYPIIAPEARIWVLLTRVYGVERHLRGIGWEGAVARPPAPAAPRRARVEGPDLMDEAAFEALYHGGIPQKSPEDLAAPDPLDAALDPSRWEALFSSLGCSKVGRLPPGPPFALTTRAAVTPEPSPLAFPEAIRFLEGVSDRSAIAHTVLRYARSIFKRAVLFTVHRDVAAGWEGLGEGVDRAAVVRSRVRLGQPGALETVIATRAHLLGPLLKTEQNLELARALGGEAPRNAFLLPVLALGRVVNVLYADNGRDGLVEADNLGDLLILAARIARSYEALVAAHGAS